MNLTLFIALFLFSTTLSGSIIWFTYPHLFAMFPNAQGILAESLGWWDSVCISFLSHAIFGKIQVSNK